MSNINIAIVAKREGPGYPSPFDATTPKAFGNGWVTTAGHGPVKVRGGAATAVGGIAHVGTNEPARQDALARLPKWLDEKR